MSSYCSAKPMPASNTGATQQQPRRCFSLVRCVASCLIALIVLVGLDVFRFLYFKIKELKASPSFWRLYGRDNNANSDK
ncbi:hypothetical protein GQ457_07G035350 [Hibiscus cannabinus]